MTDFDRPFARKTASLGTAIGISTGPGDAHRVVAVVDRHHGTDQGAIFFRFVRHRH